MDFNGYPGLHHLAAQVMEFVKPCKKYVEPLAGLGRTIPFVKSEKIILNDMSNFAVSYLRQKFPFAEVTQEDFIKCAIHHDSKDTTILFDPPYRSDSYEANPKAYYDRKPKQYYQDILDLCESLKSTWFICADVTGYGGNVFEDIPYNKIELFSSQKVLFGKKAHIQLISNQELKKITLYDFISL